MAKRGRKPKPTNLKVISGNPGKRPLNENEPSAPLLKMPRAPTHLSKTGQAEWRRTGKLLWQLGVLTALDLVAFAMYCDTYAKMIKAQTATRRYGLVMKTKNGNVVLSSYVIAEAKYFNQCKAMLAEFGMTPSSRTRISAIPLDKPESGKPKGFAQFKNS